METSETPGEETIEARSSAAEDHGQLTERGPTPAGDISTCKYRQCLQISTFSRLRGLCRRGVFGLRGSNEMFVVPESNLKRV